MERFKYYKIFCVTGISVSKIYRKISTKRPILSCDPEDEICLMMTEIKSAMASIGLNISIRWKEITKEEYEKVSQESYAFTRLKREE